MRYERKLKYLDYRERGERLRSIGFVKLEVRDESCNISLQIRGLHQTDTYRKKLYLMAVGQEQALGELNIEQGGGQLELRGLQYDNLGNTGISYGQLEGIRIPLGAGREIYCRISDNKMAQKAVETGQENRTPDTLATSPALEPTPMAGTENRSKAEPDIVSEPVSIPVSEMNSGSMPEAVPEQESGSESGTELEPMRDAEPIPETGQGGTSGTVASPELTQTEEASDGHSSLNASGTADNTSGNVKREQTMRQFEVMAEDKWRQLEKVYPHIEPFGDERDFLSIGPSDFVVLSEKYYPMVNNSFLLHGYYNYHHLVLCKRPSREGNRYYIGVPGNFYDKEKQVALLFGFESFECGEEPAQTGDYGYYMMRILL
ncbi:MAG: DUF6128 domain-containing protein [Roseburia sp.]|nr:DUF6128 domain-containing protein [Roseburia sp.]